jgi:transposase
VDWLLKSEFLELTKTNPDELYDVISKKFSELESLIHSHQKLIEKQSQTIQLLEEKNLKLESRVRELESRLNQNSKNSSKPPSSDSFKKNLETRKSSRRKSGGQFGHKGTNLLMVKVPDTIQEYPAPLNCESCGNTLIDIDSEMSKAQEFDIPEIKIFVTEHQVEKKVCGCGHCNISYNAPILKNHTFYGDRIKSLIIYLKNHQMLPFHRTKQIIQDVLNHSISEGTFHNVEKECSEKLKVYEDIIKEKILNSTVVGADETSTRTNGKNYWVHTAVSKLFSYFSVSKKRGMDGIESGGILNHFKGTLVHDFFKPYLKLLCKHVFCNAHILRELISVTETTKHIWAEQMIQVLLLALETKKEYKQNRPEQEIINEIESLYDKAIQLGEKENPDFDVGGKKSKEINLLKRMKKYKPEITRFMGDPNIPFDNNASERALRMIKVKNKISGCFRSVEGVENFCRVRSFMESCRKQNLKILNSITMVFKNQNFQFSAE